LFGWDLSTYPKKISVLFDTPISPPKHEEQGNESVHPEGEQVDVPMIPRSRPKERDLELGKEKQIGPSY